MPINYNSTKLWFNTKEELDEYDDRMISNIQLTTDVESDDNYCLMFNRVKQERYLTLDGKKAIRELEAAKNILNSPNYIQKYFLGKNDHTIDRYWNVKKSILSWVVGYFLLRELPIRNFYARSSIMIFYGCLFYQRKSSFNPLGGRISVLQDQFTHKDIRNYQVYHDMSHPIIPNNYNKIPEAKVWEMNQPAYMREVPEAKMSQISRIIMPPKPTPVAWDGTFNMPLEGLAHPLHKDCQQIDFVWWEY